MESKLLKYATSERAYYERKSKYEADKNKWLQWKDDTMKSMKQLGLWDVYINQLNNEKLSKKERDLIPDLNEFVAKAKEIQPVYPSDPNLLIFPLGPYNIYEHDLTLADAVTVYQLAKISIPVWLADMQEGERLCAEFDNPDEEYFIKAVLLRHGAAHVDSSTRSTIALNASDQWYLQNEGSQLKLGGN